VPDYAIFILRFILFAAVHSLFAADRVKLLMQRAAGNKLRWYRLSYNLASLIMFGWVIEAYRHSSVLYYVPGVASLLMYLLQTIIIVVLFMCLRKTGTATFLGFSQLRTDAPAHLLVTDGCYALVRHPLYLFSMLFLILTPVMTLQWALLSVLCMPYFIIGGLIEERRLEKEFGNQFRRYQSKVPFMIPRLRFPGRSPVE